MAIKPSPHLALFLLLFHAIAATAVYATAMPQPAKLAIFALILLSLFYYLARDALLLFPGSWREVLLERDGISVIARDGSRLTGQGACKAVASPYFAVLHIRPEGHRRAISRVIFPDAVGKDAFRELSVYLRYAQ